MCKTSLPLVRKVKGEEARSFGTRALLPLNGLTAFFAKNAVVTIEYHLALRVVREHDQERWIAGGNLTQEERQTPIFFVVFSMGGLADEFVVE